MLSFLRTVLTILVVLVATPILATIVVIGAALRIPHRQGGMFDRIPRVWCQLILRAAGVDVVVHGRERIAKGGTFIFAANHVSLFDIPALVQALPQHYFVAKSELFKVPAFGPGIRAVGTIPIERNNQKSAFGSYTVAAERIRNGSSVVVFPEGTRGTSYPVRPFKKGPFVLAVQAGVPIVPCLVHGTIEILPKKSLLMHSGTVHVHVLEPVPTAGLTYEDRDALATTVHDRMATAMTTLYHNA